jgi:hypothetical protein
MVGSSTCSGRWFSKRRAIGAGRQPPLGNRPAERIRLRLKRAGGRTNRILIRGDTLENPATKAEKILARALLSRDCRPNHNGSTQTMHDIDGTQLALRQNEYEFNFETEGESGEAEAYEQEGTLGEAETMELASELLEVQNEEELEQFLGSLVQKIGSAASGAASAVGNFARTPTGQALVGVLKDAAKTALPAIGTAVGSAYGGPLGGQLGGLAGQGLGAALGLELEGLSNEDQHFEVAQQFVRLGEAATQNAAALRAAAGSPQQKAKAALIEAAKTYAPGLIRPTARNGSGSRQIPEAGYGGGQTQAARQIHRRHSGRWIRRGDTLVLMGV